MIEQKANRRIVSLWLPSFATDRLTRTGAPFAGWHQRPFATVTSGQGGLRIAAANAAAEAHGIGPGQGMADARALRPDLKTTEAHPDDDMAALERLADWCGRYTPWTAVEAPTADGQGGAWLDVSGCAHLFGGEEAMVADMLDRLGRQGLAARAGLADTPGAAWAAARFGDGPAAIIPEGAIRQLMPGLPTAALRLPPVLVETLRRLGLRRVGDLMGLARGALAARFGSVVAWRLDQMLGVAGEPLSPRRPPPAASARLAFAEPIGRPEDIAAALDRLLAAVTRTLEADRLGARRLELEAFRVDGTVGRIAVGTGRPVRDPRHLARLFAEPLTSLDTGFGIEALALSVLVREPLDVTQTELVDDARNMLEHSKKDGELSLLADRLLARLGADGVVRPAPVASHLPERSAQRLPPLSKPPLPAWPRRRRPVRLLVRPEPVEVVAAAGDVATVTWRHTAHRIVRADGPERLTPEWWRSPLEPQLPRDYYRVEDDHGRRLWLMRHGGRWFVQGVFA